MKDLERIRKLLALADSTTFPDEAKSCRAKAEALMQKAGINKEQVRPRQYPPPPQESWPMGGVTVVFGGMASNVTVQGVNFSQDNVILRFEWYGSPTS